MIPFRIEAKNDLFKKNILIYRKNHYILSFTDKIPGVPGRIYKIKNIPK